MKKLSIKKLSDYLEKIVDHKIKASLMLWGAPGIGKSSLAQVAKQMNLDLIGKDKPISANGFKRFACCKRGQIIMGTT